MANVVSMVVHGVEVIWDMQKLLLALRKHTVLRGLLGLGDLVLLIKQTLNVKT